jgi:NAD(P)-dependent dehydrogenase (short-subunit alcohol dehydrogenase family)
MRDGLHRQSGPHSLAEELVDLAIGIRDHAGDRRGVHPAMRDVVLAGPLMGRAAKPEEMAGMVLFLCSPRASYATGQTFIVDAGQTAH